MSPRPSFVTNGRILWLVASVLAFAICIWLGAAFGSVWLGVFIGVFVSLIWLIAYESWRGHQNGLAKHSTRRDDGAEV